MLVVVLSILVAACGEEGATTTTATGQGETTTTEGADTTTSAADTTTSAADETTTSQAMEAEPITVQMAFRWALSQQYSTFLVGVPAGIYAQYGLEPEFIEGTGSATTAQLLATGQADFGAAVSSNAAMGVVNEGGEIKMIGETLPSVTVAVLSGNGTCIETPQDMIGTTIAVPPGTTQSQMFPALLAANDIDPSEITVVNAAADTLVPSFLAGQFDGYVSYIVSNVPLLRGEGIEPCYFLFSDFGVTLAPGETVISHQGLMDSNPDLVSRFVSAVEDSHRYAVEHPDEACAAGVEMFPDQMTPEVCEQAVGLTVEQLSNAMVDDEPFVCIDMAALATTTQLLVDYAEFQNPLPPEDYATNEFVTAGCPS
jgi:NitT/TauT family transport system substrate-binding protein